jgi:two-component system osmolarity sensor histidine kinase EnvZ
MLSIHRVGSPGSDSSPRWAWLRVHDNGPGIPAESREEIFLPGKRLPGAHESGSGMGLAIVRKIIEHYGGTIFVDRECEQGTAMVLSLPAA